MIFCPLYSGSSGNSIFVASDKGSILIDAGLPGKSIENALVGIGKDPRDIDGIFITHEHIDHVKGVGVLSRRYGIPIFANKLTWKGMEKTIGKIKEENIKIIEDTVDIKDMNIKSYRIPHDAADPMGYSVYDGKTKVSIATDLGFFSEEVDKGIRNSDIVLLESNHDVEMLKFGPYPYNLKRRILSNVGHLSNYDCGKAIVNMLKYNCKRVVLGHLSKTNNYPELAYETVVSVLRENGVKINEDVFVTMAKRDMPSNYIEF
ncbi:putative metallo-hydrolase YycJ [Clostridium homopropionicum DSM 5847]|uniref:Putative metallo-hydrolase YycJ n=1 Tax=Clostridium homopropionicum DSM 5847 TaxID=1121318 RepID=A0A0L6Z889_9CLOT|nr:MBL fold metallo-hydrolase [Clostridium homopropionicum]KOA19033.1 putative metallo-hydrolase YycJ [Clostridium homopropionicum DSM 5847]SFG91355.1 Phosphoribosyl 1,2-cyclic phosphodiesterase [Clostridium homopropionicum]